MLSQLNCFNGCPERTAHSPNHSTVRSVVLPKAEGLLTAEMRSKQPGWVVSSNPPSSHCLCLNCPLPSCLTSASRSHLTPPSPCSLLPRHQVSWEGSQQTVICRSAVPRPRVEFLTCTVVVALCLDVLIMRDDCKKLSSQKSQKSNT